MKDSPGFHAEVVEAIRAKNLDVLVRFGFNTIPCGILAAARFGVWSYHYGDNDCYRGAPAHLWELVEHNPVSGVSLQILKEKRDDGKTLCKGLFATEPGGISASRNRIQPHWASAVFLIQKLFELHQYDWEHVEQRIAPPVPYRGRKAIYCSPNNREMVAWLAPLILGKAARRMFRWFFTTVVEPRGYGGMLMLFSAPSLTGDWKLHPDNPVSADVRTARGAGSIFRWGGRLLRPCQDGSRGYGCALNFQEIAELTRTRYRELPVATVRPWLRGQTGTHTYNACEGLEVIDGSFRYSAKRLGSPRVSGTPPQSTSAD